MWDDDTSIHEEEWNPQKQRSDINKNHVGLQKLSEAAKRKYWQIFFIVVDKEGSFREAIGQLQFLKKKYNE